MKEFTLAIDYVGCIILKWRIVILCKEVCACDEINVLVVLTLHQIIINHLLNEKSFFQIIKN